MTGRVIATICARGGSKGLPRKNVLPFAGKPLIAHTIELALACSAIDGVYVSTDDDEIAGVAERLGAIVPYCRPAELASDEAGKLPVIQHLVRHLEQAGAAIATIVDLQPTSPLRTLQDLEAALRVDPGADLVVTASPPSHNPYYSLAEAGPNGLLHPCKGNGAVRRQDVPDVWAINGAVYVWKRAALDRAVRDGFWSVGIRVSPMPRERSVDIDDRLDFDLAEWLFQRTA